MFESSSTVKPLPIPSPPRFSDFKFSTIGQQPDLLKRMMVPVEHIDFVEDAPEAPINETTPENVVDQCRSRPSLLEALASNDVTMEELVRDGETLANNRGSPCNNPTTPPTSENYSLAVPLPTLPSSSVLRPALDSPPPFRPLTTSNELQAARSRSQSPSNSHLNSMSNNLNRESSVHPDDETPTIATLRGIHTRVIDLVGHLLPVDNSEALRFSRALNDQYSKVLTTARHSHTLATQALVAAQESLNVSQECLTTAESIQPRVCEVLEAVCKIGSDGPNWNTTLQTLRVNLDQIDQWARQKEAYDTMQREKLALESLARQKKESAVQTMAASPPDSTGHDIPAASEEEESAEREWREKVAERQRLAEEELRRCREVEERLEREQQDAQKEADARAARLAELRAERQRAEEEEKRKQDLEALETEKREAALEIARKGSQARPGQRKEHESNQKFSEGQEAAFLEREKKGMSLDDGKRKPFETEAPRQRQDEPEDGQRREAEFGGPKNQQVEAARGAGGVVQRLEVTRQHEAGHDTMGQAATTGPLAAPQGESGSAQQRDDTAGSALHGEERRKTGAEDEKRPDIEASKVQGMVQLQQAIPEGTEIEVAKRDLQNQASMPSPRSDEQYSPSRIPTIPPLDLPLQAVRTSSSDDTPISPPPPSCHSSIGNITSRKTLAACYKHSLISPKETKQHIAREHVTSAQKCTTSDSFTLDVRGPDTFLPTPCLVQQRHSPNTTSVFSKPDNGVHQRTRSINKEPCVIKQLHLDIENNMPIDHPQATPSPPPHHTGSFGTEIRLRSKFVPSSPNAIRSVNGLPNALFIKSEAIAQKVPGIQQGNTCLSSTPLESVVGEAKPVPTVAAQIPLPKVEQSEDAVSQARPQTSKPPVTVIPVPERSASPFTAPPVPPDVSRHSISPVNTSRYSTANPRLQTPPTLPQSSELTDSHVTVHRPLSPTSSVASGPLRAPRARITPHIQNIITDDEPCQPPSPLPNLSRPSSTSSADRTLLRSSMQPKADVHDPFDNRMGPDLMIPSAWDGGQGDVHDHRRRHQRDRYTPSPTPVPRPRSPHPTQVISRNGYHLPNPRDHEPPIYWSPHDTRSKSREVPARRPLVPLDTDRARYESQHAPPIVGRKRGRDEDRPPGPPQRRPRGDHRQYNYSNQRMTSSSYMSDSLEFRTFTGEPSTSAVHNHLPVSDRVDVPGPGDVPTVGEPLGQARATPLMQRMDATPESNNYWREQYPHGYIPQHLPHNHGPSSVQPGLLGRISEPIDSRYHDQHMPGYRNHSNSTRRPMNRSRPQRYGGRGRGDVFQNRNHSQALINRLTPSKYSES